MLVRRVVGVAAAGAAAAICLRAANAACSDDPLDISWASSSNRIYINSGCATIDDIMVERSDNNGAKGPLYHFDQEANTIVGDWTGTYYLTSHIHIINGATLRIDGDNSGTGDCKTLLLASDSTITGDDSLNIRAHGGNLVITDTKIFSWNIAEGTYDTNVDDGRSYISAITEFITGRDVDLCDDDPLKGTDDYSTGEAKENMGVARMDIYDSEIGYLGWDNSESYGVSYKARGLCKTLANLDIFDDDQPFDYAVYGDIKRSELHHNYFGHYSFGHQGGNWNFNSVHDNIGYGFDPHDDSDHLTIKGNEVYNNGWHGIIASKRCTDISIRLNKVWDNGQNEGIRLSNGANRNFIHKNDIRHEYNGGDDEGYAVYMYRGTDEPEAEGNENGDILENEFHRNTVYSERPEAVKIKYAQGNSFLNNVITKGEYASFEASTDNKWKRNAVPDDFYFVFDDESCFDSNDEDLELC